MIEIEELTTADIPTILADNIDRWECHLCFGGKYPLDPDKLIDWIDVSSAQPFKLIVDGVWVGFFALYNNSGQPTFVQGEKIKVSNAYVFKSKRNQGYQDKPYIYWIAVHSALKSKELYPTKSLFATMSDFLGGEEAMYAKLPGIPRISPGGLSSTTLAGWSLHEHQPSGANGHIGNIYILTHN
jgi:hypothetical protein